MTIRRRNAVRETNRAFTLIELLVVVAIIALLIGILVPSLSAARTQAKNLSTRSTLKAIGDALEMFRSENDDDPSCRRTGGYPTSALQDDPTESGETQAVFGAQLLIRYLVGKDLKGYVPKDNVPADILAEAEDGWEQKNWYDTETTTSTIDRAGPYIDTQGLKLVRSGDLPGAAPNGPFIEESTMDQVVATDAFGYPILYYAANARLASRPDAQITTFGSIPGGAAEGPPGIYTYMDNAWFTGACDTSGCVYPPMDLVGVLGGEADDTENPYYVMSKYGFAKADTIDHLNISEDTKTFPYYILNENAYESSQHRTVTPVRRDSFILITAGKDGRFGTADDVTNFE